MGPLGTILTPDERHQPQAAQQTIGRG